MPSRHVSEVRIVVQTASRAANIPSPARLRRWVRASVRTPACLTLRIVSSNEARLLNRRFRNRDYPTNVLSFGYGPAQGRLKGDIVLCAPVVAKEARLQGKSLLAHYAHLTVHGVLHLRGWNHETGPEAARMESLERRILAGLGFPDPYEQG